MTREDTRAVLWDLDGTVLDSRNIHWEAWRTFADRAGRPMTYEFFSETFGFWNEVILRRHFGQALEDATLERYSLEKEVVYRDLLRRAGAKPLPGVREWLAWAKAHGWRQALATMAPRGNIDVTLAALGLADAFEAIVSAEDVQQGKPDPEVFLVAAARLGVAPARCTVIEDSAQGVEAARRAGMRCIGVGPLYETLDAGVTLRTLADSAPEMLERA